jgi:hypothetical protein
MEDSDTKTGPRPEERKESEKTAARREGSQTAYVSGSIPFPPGQGPAPAPVTYYQPYYVYQNGAGEKKSSKSTIGGGILLVCGVLTLILACAAGAISISDPFNFVRNEHGDMMGTTGELSGVVIFQNSAPAENVTITVVDTEQAAITNSAGEYRIIGVVVGSHEIRVEKDGYKTLLQKVYISESVNMGETNAGTKVDFQLQPGSGSLRVGGTGATSEEWGMGFARTMIGVCSALWLLFGITMIAGGYFALQKTRFPLAIAGGVMGLMTPMCIFAMIALVLLFLARDDFPAGGKGAEGDRTLKEAELLKTADVKRR